LGGAAVLQLPALDVGRRAGDGAAPSRDDPLRAGDGSRPSENDRLLAGREPLLAENGPLPAGDHPPPFREGVLSNKSFEMEPERRIVALAETYLPISGSFFM